LVLLSYCWWGSAAIDGDGDKIQPTYSKWIEMFEDMEWVLECMVHDLECSVEQLEEQNGEDADESDHELGPVAKQFVCF